MNLPELYSLYADFKQIVDVEDGMGRLRKNKKIYSHLLASFVGNTHINEIKDHFASSDYEETQKTAHMIKGIAANLSLPEVYRLSSGIDAKLKSGDTAVQDDIDQLDDAISKTITYIDIVTHNLEDINF